MDPLIQVEIVGAVLFLLLWVRISILAERAERRREMLRMYLKGYVDDRVEALAEQLARSDRADQIEFEEIEKQINDIRGFLSL